MLSWACPLLESPMHFDELAQAVARGAGRP